MLYSLLETLSCLIIGSFKMLCLVSMLIVDVILFCVLIACRVLCHPIMLILGTVAGFYYMVNNMNKPVPNNGALVDVRNRGEHNIRIPRQLH